MFRRLWVWILALFTEWTWHFFILICCKNCNNVWLKISKINEEEVGVGPFLLKKQCRIKPEGIQKSIFPKILFWCEPNRFWFNSKTLTANIDVKTDSSFVTGFNWWRGAAITQWIHLCLPSSLPGFEFRALNLSFYHLLSKFCYLSCEKNENKQKEAGFGQLKKFINDDWLGNMLEKIMKLFPAF